MLTVVQINLQQWKCAFGNLLVFLMGEDTDMQARELQDKGFDQERPRAVILIGKSAHTFLGLDLSLYAHYLSATPVELQHLPSRVTAREIDCQ